MAETFGPIPVALPRHLTSGRRPDGHEPRRDAGARSGGRRVDGPDLVQLGRLGSYSRAAASKGDLTDMYLRNILMHMRTTLILDDELIEKARDLTGVREKTALVHQGLRELIARASARRLAALGGSEPALRAPKRRRPSRRTR